MLARAVHFWELPAMRIILGLALFSFSFAASTAELRIDLADMPTGKTPTNFSSTAAGTGKPGDWRVEFDEAQSALAPFTPQAPSVTRHAVLGQFAQDTTDEHFPLLIFNGGTFSDFTLTTKFKIVSGRTEQMAGIAFRVQDEKNFYVIRANALNRNVRFYKVVNGIRSAPIGPELGVHKGSWHELKITCRGNEIRAWLDGNEAFPPLTDMTFRSGKIAFWTKSDSVSYFTDTVINYKPNVPLAQILVQDMIKKYPRIQTLKVFVLEESTGKAQVVASKDAKELGVYGGKYELDTVLKGEIFYAKAKDHLEMVMPLRDRNGDPIAAVRVHLNSFPGQTEQNALIRVTPIVKEMQLSVQSRAELVE